MENYIHTKRPARFYSDWYFCLQMVDYFQSGGAQAEEFEIGLHETFKAVDGHDIDQFDGLDSENKVLTVQASATRLR